MTEHPLDSLLQPSSIALLGASERAESPGATLAGMIINSEYEGEVYPVNPGYPQILGLPCYPDLDSLPKTVDHVVIALGNAHLEAALTAVIRHGAKAATIYSSGVLDQDTSPPLQQRLADMARAAGIHICGINGMGFYNLEQQLYVGIFPRAAHIIRGGISYIAQSGSAFTTLCHNGCRLGFNLCASAGNEITTTVADYMDWCLERESTQAIGLFLETVRDPQRFVAALRKANTRSIPVVILKIGKSELGASMAVTHTGAIAGNHSAFQALCRRHGVIEVNDFDEMAAILMLLQNGRAAASGKLAAAFESGGFRELVTDTADELGIDFAVLESATVNELEQHLDPGLKAENPLDVWGSHDRFEARFEACLMALMQDPNVAAGVFFSNFRDGYYLSEAIYRVMTSVSAKVNKPIALATCYCDLANTTLCQRAYAAGIPFVDGVRETLLAFRHLFAYQAFKQQYAERTAMPQQAPEEAQEQALEQAQKQSTYWRQKLAQNVAHTLEENIALELLSDFSIPVVRRELVHCESELTAAAAKLGYPVVLKTAQPGINHKSDQGGVVVDIQSEPELLRHYRDINQRLGSMALVSQMVSSGVEIALGTVNDRQFGPIIMVAAGGILVEFLDDRAIAMCPLDAAQAETLLGSLKLNRLLLGVRGQAAVNRQALIDAIVNLSQLAFGLRDSIAEIDINPVIANANDAVAVDALVLCDSPGS
jgi:acyl-CoA synthetase (NDP forming)